MPSIQETIVAHLKADSAFVAMVGDRLHPGQIPDHEPQSPWVYFLATDTSPRPELESSGEIEAEVSFSVLADDYASGRDVVLVLLSLMHGMTGGQIERSLWAGTRESAVDGGYAFEVTFKVFGNEAAIVPTSLSLPRVEVREDGLYFNGFRLTTADQLFDDRYGRLAAANIWTGNQTVAGVVSATSFAGNGAALTGLPTQTNGQSVLANSVNLTEADGVFQDTGLSVALPSAGTYLICYNVRVVQIASGVSGAIQVRLFDVAALAEVTSSRRLPAFPADTSNRQTQSAFSHLVTVGSARTIRLEAARTGGVTWSFAQVTSNSDGVTTMSFIKLG